MAGALGVAFAARSAFLKSVSGGGKCCFALLGVALLGVACSAFLKPAQRPVSGGSDGGDVFFDNLIGELWNLLISDKVIVFHW